MAITSILSTAVERDRHGIRDLAQRPIDFFRRMAAGSKCCSLESIVGVLGSRCLYCRIGQQVLAIEFTDLFEIRDVAAIADQGRR